LDIEHPGGNAVAIIDYNRGVVVAHCSIRHVGEVGIVVQGSTAGIDATGGNYPVGTHIHHNFVYEVATKMRGGCFFFQSLAAQTELDHNVALNGPRAGINFNDGMGGGNNVHHNLIANFVRESADHGNENSWDRVPFITTFNNGSKSLVPAFTRNHHNLWLMPNFGSNIDHDDGSSYYNDSYNVILGGGGWTKHSGVSQMALGNVWYHGGDGGVCASFSNSNEETEANSIGPFADNVCIFMDASHEPAVANGSKSMTRNNSFYNTKGAVSINGMDLADAQAAGMERGSSVHTFASLGTDGMFAMMRNLLHSHDSASV
jgi:hypothetical protein